MDAIELGATLYIPASRPDLAGILSGRHPSLRSAVLCLEDSIHHQEVPLALTNLAKLLRDAARAEPAEGRAALFVRPRDPAMLAHILGFEGVEALAGFVIPKATPDNFPAWLHGLADDRHLLMPTLETPRLLDGPELRSLRDQLLAVQPRILAIRIGGNDLLKAIGARRSALRTAYDGPLGAMIAGFVAAFAPFGFALAAPVCEHFANADLLREESSDPIIPLVTKTPSIPSRSRHPAAYRSCGRACRAGRWSPRPRVVFASRARCSEPATHRYWPI